MKSLLLGMCFALCLAGVARAQDAAGAATDQVVIRAESNWLEDAAFYFFAVLTVGSALGVILAGNIVHMAACLFATFGAVALLFFLLQAYFLGAVQLIVYAGGILVLLVFGIMLTTTSPWVKFEIKRAELAVCGLVSVLLFGGLAMVLSNTRWNDRAAETNFGVNQFGQSLLTDYLIPLEMAGVVLMIVMIGAAYLARQEKN